MYDCFYFCFEPTPYNFQPKVGCIFLSRQTRYFSRHGFLLSNVSLLPVKDISPRTSTGHRASCLCGCTNMQTINCLSVSNIWICRFFTTLQHVSASFFLTPGISFCADTYPRSNLHETILLRQAFCALLNDGCLREMVIMIDSEPQVTDSPTLRGFTTFKTKLLIKKCRCINQFCADTVTVKSKLVKAFILTVDGLRNEPTLHKVMPVCPDCEQMKVHREN